MGGPYKCLNLEWEIWGNWIYSIVKKIAKATNQSSDSRELLGDAIVERLHAERELRPHLLSIIQIIQRFLTHCLLLPKKIWFKHCICHTFACLLDALSNLISYLHKIINLCLKLYTWKILLQHTGNIMAWKLQDSSSWPKNVLI